MSEVVTCLVFADCDKPKERLLQEICELVRKQVGAVAVFKEAIIVKRLPKTRSGKIPRHTLTDMVAGKPYQVQNTHIQLPVPLSFTLQHLTAYLVFKIPTTVEDAGVYPDLETVLTEAGYKVGKMANWVHLCAQNIYFSGFCWLIYIAANLSLCT